MPFASIILWGLFGKRRSCREISPFCRYLHLRRNTESSVVYSALEMQTLAWLEVPYSMRKLASRFIVATSKILSSMNYDCVKSLVTVLHGLIIVASAIAAIMMKSRYFWAQAKNIRLVQKIWKPFDDFRGGVLILLLENSQAKSWFCEPQWVT